MKGSNGAVESLMMLVHDCLQSFLKLLARAAVLLERAADACRKAAVSVKKRSDARAMRQKAILKAMAGNFAAIASVGDRVALIAAVESYNLSALGSYPDNLAVSLQRH